MSYNAPDFTDDVIALLTEDGYQVHAGVLDSHGDPRDPRAGESPDVFWFTWAAPGMVDCEVGENLPSELYAWSDALAHRLDNSAIPMDEDDKPATLPAFRWLELDESARFEILQTMIRYGGGFVHALALAWQLADQTHSDALGAAFDGLVREYEQRTVLWRVEA